MKRRNFFKKLGLGFSALIIAPKLFSKEIEVNEITKIPEKYKNGFDVNALENRIKEIEETKNIEVSAILTNKYFFEFKHQHSIKLDDVIIVSLGFGNTASYVVTEIINENQIKAIPFKDNFLVNAMVVVGVMYRKYNLGS